MCKCMPPKDNNLTIVRSEVAGEVTFDYHQCDCGSITVTADNGTEIQAIAKVSNPHYPWGNVSILASDYVLFARMMYL